MPQRPYSTAIGYDTNPALPKETPNIDPTAIDTTVAGFRMENDVVNAAELLSRPKFQPDVNFNTEGRLKADGLWDDYKWNFVGVDSEPEYDYVLSRIRREEKDREILQAAGVGGIVAQVAAGVLSPTVLLPFVGELRGVKALVSGAGWGFVGGVAQELPLQLNQETRTPQETAFSVSMSTLVGGVLGGAVGFLTKPLDDVARDMADIPGKEAIPEAPFASIGPKGVGAEAAPPRVDAGGLAGALGQENEFLSRLGPVTRVLQSTSPQARWMMAQLSDAGLALKGNIEGIATSVGGTAENNILVHWAKAADSVRLIDDAFARYRLGKSQVGLRDKISASFKGTTPTGGKLSKKQFREAVGRAMFNQDASEIPEVAEVAAFVRKRVYDELYQRAQEVGIYKRALPDDEGGDVAKVVGDQSYLNRDYKLEVVAARRTEFVDILTKHFAQKLGADYTAELQKLLDRAAKDVERLEDMQRTPEEVEQLQQKFREQIEALDMARTEEEAALDDYIADLRSMAADRNLSKEQRKDARDMAKLLGETGGAAERQAKRRELKRRLNNLNRSFAMRNKTLANKLQRVSRIEELSLNTMNRTVRAAQKFLKQATQLSDEKFAEEISKLKDKFAKFAAQYDKGEERIAELANSPEDKISDLLAQDVRQQERAERLTQIAEELDFVEQLDRESLRLLVQEGLDELLVKTNRINGRRFARAQRLRDEVKNLDPKMVEKEIDNIRKGMDDRTRNFFDKWQENGASKVEVRAEHTPDFTTYAKQTAEKVTDKILGTNARLAGMDLIMEPKGAELARVLDIDSNAIMDFLETDIEHLVSQYIRTLAPDIEIMKKLGEYAPDMGRNLEFEKLNIEQSDRVRALETSMKAEGKSKEQIEKAVQKVNHEYAMVRRDLQAVIGRLRHEWGVPADPTAIMTRIGRVAMNLNVLRYMNMVTISSLPDIAGPIMKYGMMRTFRKGWVPFIKQLRNLQFDNRELRLAGAALDVVLHSRAHAISDIGDYMVRGSKFEKGTEWLTSKIGLVALFDYWTAAMKQVAGSAANAKVMDDIRLLMEGGGTEAQRAKATDFLASAGINEDLARAIWKEIQKPGGSDIVDGVLWPNTEAWDNASGAVDAYRAALIREVNRTIVTPGVERPLMSDTNLTAKLIFQFKSFALSSTTKIFLSGLQQRDMAVAQGTMISLALGALSYYIWANITGGKALEDMNAALEDFDGEGWKKFADEAISRSGILASISMGQDIMSTLPMIGPYTTLSGQRSSRQADNDFIDATLGPSLDLVRRGVRALPGLDNESGDIQWDRSNLHQLRLMLPFQNHFALRHIFNAIEQAVPEID